MFSKFAQIQREHLHFNRSSAFNKSNIYYHLLLSKETPRILASLTVLKMGINNEGVINRRQLLVKAGSFMKLSLRKSRGLLIDDDEDDENDNNDNSSLRQRGRRKKGNSSVRFSDNLRVEPSNRDGPMSDEEIENRWYQVCYDPLRRLWRCTIDYSICFQQ
jgi:hypothetical protein